MFRIKSTLPKKLNYFTLRNCNKVILKKNLFGKNNITVFTIEDCGELSIKEGSIKSVKDLKIKNVANIILDFNALNHVRAERIEFDNVTIAPPSVRDQVHAEIYPEKVTSCLVFKNSRLPSGMGLHINSGDDKNNKLVTGFYNCELGKPETFKITSSQFEMIGNTFTEQWSDTRAAIEYEDQLILRSNSLGGYPLPDVVIYTTDKGVEIIANSSMPSNKSDETWFDHLGLDYKGVLSEDGPQKNCSKNSQKNLRELKITCPNKKSLQSLLKSRELFQLSVEHSSRQGKAPQVTDAYYSSSTVHPTIDLSILITALFVFKTSVLD